VIRSTFRHVSGQIAKVAPNALQANKARAWMLSLLAALIKPLATEIVEFAVS